MPGDKAHRVKTTRNYNPHNKVPEKLEADVLKMEAKGVPVVEIRERIKEKYERDISRQTIYDILGRYGVRRTNTQKRLNDMRKETGTLVRAVTKFANRAYNDEISKAEFDKMIERLGTFEAKWLGKAS